MLEKGKNEKIDNFIEKCKEDMQKLKKDMFNALDNGNEVKKDYVFLAYKITMFAEILDMFLCNSAEVGLGYYVKIYGDSENPLDDIFTDMISLFTEPKLVTKKGMTKLLDKKGI